MLYQYVRPPGELRNPDSMQKEEWRMEKCGDQARREQLLILLETSSFFSSLRIHIYG